MAGGFFTGTPGGGQPTPGEKKVWDKICFSSSFLLYTFIYFFNTLPLPDFLGWSSTSSQYHTS